jgi:hypothetical protein
VGRTNGFKEERTIVEIILDKKYVSMSVFTCPLHHNIQGTLWPRQGTESVLETNTYIFIQIHKGHGSRIFDRVQRFRTSLRYTPPTPPSPTCRTSHNILGTWDREH